MSKSIPVVNTTCAYCGVGCGIQIHAHSPEQRRVDLTGDPDHPANFGKLCAKGATLAETISLEKRLLQPEIQGHTVDWQTATDYIADKLHAVKKQHGPDAIGIYLSGQLLTEDYYVANKFAKGFLGTANVDTNSRLCMSSSVVGHKRAFGEDLVPTCYEDIDHADLMVLVGSNTAWCHPIVYQRIKSAKQNNPALKVVVVDPRRTDTCDIADLHLAISAGSDVTLFNGLLKWLTTHSSIDQAYIESHTEGFAQAMTQAELDAPSVEQVATTCSIEPADLTTFYRWFQETPKTLTFYSQGVNQSVSGSDKVNAIINCHLATGRIGKAGAGPFSLTGQPNAMGGREVGGLANQLAAHMDFDPTSVERVARFWQASDMATQPGLKTIDMFEAARQGKIKVLWIMATNPAVSLPNSNKVREALEQCELVIVSDCIAETDTMAYADVKLPAQGWGEKNGTVTNSERCISRQRAFLASPNNAKPDWQIVASVARAMGFEDAFNYAHPYEVFREHAQLSCFENNREQRYRLFNLTHLAHLSDEQYESLTPAQWPHTSQPTKRLFSDGDYPTLNGKANFVAVRHRTVANSTGPQYPLQLNTGRIRDQWHTMTRTAFAPRLNAHTRQPFIDIHPQTATRFKVTHGGLVQITSQWGAMQAIARVTPAVQPQQIFAPMHWNDQFAPQGRVGPLVNPDVDHNSGQPELKHTPVTIEPLSFQTYAKLWVRREITTPGCDYWVKVIDSHSIHYDLAGNNAALQHFSPQPEPATLSYEDNSQQIRRLAWFQNKQLIACLFIAPQPITTNERWISQLFQKAELNSNERQALLSGQPPADVEDTGAIVCACYSIGEKTIANAIENGCCTAIEVGNKTKAGTNCGSCVGEINAMITSLHSKTHQPNHSINVTN